MPIQCGLNEYLGGVGESLVEGEGYRVQGTGREFGNFIPIAIGMKI